MKRKQLRFLLIASIFMMMTILAACGDGPGDGPGETGEPGEPGESGEIDTEATVLSFWAHSHGDSENEWMEKWVDEYNDVQDEVVIDLEIVPGDAWDQRMAAAAGAGTAPDIKHMNYNKIAFSADLGEILPLNEYVDDSVWADLHPNIEEFVSVRGEHYAIPILVEPSALLYYRTDFFEEAGLDPNSPPTTWDELIDYGKQLQDGRRSGLVAGETGDFGWTHWGWQGMIGGHPISEDWSEATINNDDYHELLTLWQTLYAENILPEQAPAGYTDIQPIADGRTAMQFNGSWAINELRRNYEDIIDNIEVAVVPTPDGDPERPTASLGGWTLTIDGQSEYPQEAADFITWLLSEDTEPLVDFFANATNFSKFSPRISVDEALDEDPVGQDDPWRAMIVEDVIPNAIPEPIYAWDISLAYVNAVERVVLEGQDVETSLQRAEDEINQYIENNDYAGTNPNLD